MIVVTTFTIREVGILVMLATKAEPDPAGTDDEVMAVLHKARSAAITTPSGMRIGAIKVTR